MRSCQRTQRWPFYFHSEFEANWKQKRLISGCLMSWLKQTNKQTNIILKCHLLLFYTTTRHFSTGLWYETKNGFYTKTGNEQLSGWTEKKLQNTSQSQTCTKKRSWSLFGGLLPVWHTTAFWILVKPLHLRSKLSKLMKWSTNHSVCSKHCQKKGPNSSNITGSHICTTNASNVEWIGLQSFASSAIFTWPLVSWLLEPLLQESWKLFAEKTL